MLQRLSFAITSIPRHALRKRRMTRGPVEKATPADSLSAILNDDERVSDELRSQLEGFSEEELVAGIKIVKTLLDSTLMIMAWFMYFCNHLDRSCLASAKIMGLEVDLGMTSNEYGLAMMLLFVAYVLAQVPSNLYLAGGRPSIYLPTMMVFWGCTCVGTAVVKTPETLYALRILLGLLEAPFGVGCLLLISSWYTRTELGLRSAILLSAPMSAHAFSGLVAHGVSEYMDGLLGHQDWRWLFIIAGSCTMFMACFAFFCPSRSHCPFGSVINGTSSWLSIDYPHNTRWFHEEERAVAQLRLIADRGVSDRNVSKWVGLRMAVKNWRVWTFASMHFLSAIGASLHNFFPSVVKTLGFSQATTLWMTAPPYLVAVVIAISIALFADHRRNASFYIIGTASLAMAGFLLFLFVQSGDRQGLWVRYTATFMMLGGAHAANPVILAWTQKTIQHPKEMRAVAIAIVGASGNIAQIVTSELYPNRWAPRYMQPMSLNTACGLGTILLAVFMREKLRRTNKKLDMDEEAIGAEMQEQGVPVDNKERRSLARSYRYVT